MRSLNIEIFGKNIVVYNTIHDNASTQVIIHLTFGTYFLESDELC